jgi:ABC-type uncharacterized transport system substrate-binding protein
VGDLRRSPAPTWLDATGEAVAEAARQATSTIPIVSSVPLNPVERGLIASYAHPGGNVTGTTWDQSAEPTGLAS